MDATDDFLNSYAFDNLGRMTRIEQEDQTGGNTVAEKRVDLTYLADGRFNTISRYADLAGTDLVATSTWGYDSAGRLTDLTHAKAANTLADYSWTYDAHSRITQMISDDGTTDYTYDATHQLTEADYSFQTDDTYAWDLGGNPTGTGYSVGTNNRLLSDGTYNYGYDDEGNLTLQTTIATGAYVEYTWDHRIRLTAVTFKTSGGTTTKKVEYDYDLLDRRIGRRVDDDGNGTFDRSERYVYDGEDVVLVYNGTGSLTHRYLHGPGYDQPLADEVFASGDLFWLLDDNQGTIRDMAEYNVATDTTSIANHIEYDAFGAITATSDANIEIFYAYTGQEWDADSGLMYYGGRWYSPTMRRFLSHDPAGFAAGDTNLARFVINAPANYVDPTGYWPEPSWNGRPFPPNSPFNPPNTLYPPGSIPLPRAPVEFSTRPPEFIIENENTEAVEAWAIWRQLARGFEGEARTEAERTAADLHSATLETSIVPFGANQCGRWVEAWSEETEHVQMGSIRWNVIEIEVNRNLGFTSVHYVVIVWSENGAALGVDVGTLGGDDHLFGPWDPALRRDYPMHMRALLRQLDARGITPPE